MTASLPRPLLLFAPQVESLSNEGFLFSTIDDFHYRSSEN